MPSKSQTSWLLAALVLAAYTHCVYSHAMEAADRHHELRSDAQPLDNSRATCENESSCICKGATLAICVNVSAPELSQFDTLCTQSAADFLGRVTEAADLRTLPHEGAAPISGGVLRAQLQRFVL